ncbi:MAG TPA: flagellar biosynthesis protein FlgL [Xanthobacteraceae bacterium]|jgi:flagellin-like hook-associated protein FlgL|nr:flagellar biosynthesis protein FlgL [Xanthobacteraceae bacterium]
MSITGPGSITAMNVAAINSMNDQLNKLTTELSTNQAAQTYSDLGSQAGIVLSLNSQLAAINGYSNTATTVGTTLSVAQSTLQQLDGVRTSVEQAINGQGTFALNNSGQTTIQSSSVTQLDNIFSLLNTQVGSNYIFSGSDQTQPSVASTNAILYGNGAQAGLTQVTANRLQADEGSNGLGRLVIPAASGSTVSISEDSSSPFGFKLGSIGSSLTGATVTGPSGSPPSASVDLTSNPNAGDSIQFALTLPDGSSQNVTLTATTASPPGANQFTIGATPSDTATNLQTALSSAVGGLTKTALPAASAIAASNNFFTSDPPQIVNGPPYATATSLVNGTTANTVFWYTGDDSSTPARQTATAQVGPTTSISYGMRANEPAIASLVANVAALAVASYSPSDPNAQASYQALSQKVTSNIDDPAGTQTISSIEADLANAQTTVSNAGKLNTQTQTTLQNMLQNIDGVNQTNIGEQLMTLQNSMSATLSVTARMADLSLVNFLAPSAG